MILLYKKYKYFKIYSKNVFLMLYPVHVPAIHKLIHKPKVGFITKLSASPAINPTFDYPVSSNYRQTFYIHRVLHKTICFLLFPSRSVAINEM